MRFKFIIRICYRHKEKKACLQEEKPLISVLSLIAKQLSNKQLSNYDFRKQKYLKRRNSHSKKLPQVLRNIDTF